MKIRKKETNWIRNVIQQNNFNISESLFLTRNDMSYFKKLKNEIFKPILKIFLDNLEIF